MIVGKIYRDRNNLIKRYKIEGHANYDDYGKDIVCAAISMLSQTTLLSLVNVCKLEENQINYIIDNEIGLLDVELSDNIEEHKLEKTQILLESLVIGINSVKDNYPKHVVLKNEEV